MSTEPLTEAASAGPDTDPLAVLPARFRIDRILGKGGMGLVVKAHDLNLGREVAIKVLPRDMWTVEEARIRFLREARAAAQLTDPSIAMIHEVADDGRYIVMELLGEENLAARLKRIGRVAPAEVRRIGLALLSALSAAHRRSIIHRDVKPSNILFDEEDRPRLVDFGIVHIAASELTRTDALMGTPAYMAPEQLRGRPVDARADVYALGATLFEAATGDMLHGQDEIRHPGERIAAVTGDSGLAEAIAGAIAERPEDRWESAAAFAEVLAGEKGREAKTVEDVGVKVGEGEGEGEGEGKGEGKGVGAEVGGAARRGRRGRLWWMTAAAAMAVAGAFVFGRGLWDGSEETAVPAVTQADAGGEAEVALALLPFAIESEHPELDFARAGLPHLLGGELRRASGVGVIGYYRLASRVATPKAGRRAWIEAARELEAQVVVEGSVKGSAGALRLTVSVERPDGSRLAEIQRTVSLDSLPAAVRSLAPDVARAAFGREVDLPPGQGAQFHAERELQLGIAALHRNEFPEAGKHVRAARDLAPGFAEAHYYLALLSWWAPNPDDQPTRAEIDKAMAGELRPDQRAFLRGLGELVDLDMPGALEHFRRVSERFPKSRDIQYGLFEALWHGGYPAEAVEVYRSMVTQSPHFQVGLIHPVTFYVSRGDSEGMRWALSRAASHQQWELAWKARGLIARRDYEGALALIERIQDGSAGPLAEAEQALLPWDLVHIHAVNGRMQVARSLARAAAEEASTGLQARWAMSAARGDEAGRRHWRERAIAAALAEPAGKLRASRIAELAVMEVADPPRAEILELLEALEEATSPERERVLRYQVGRTVLAGLLGDAALIAKSRESRIPEAAAIAEGFAAERSGQWEAAARAWRRALAFSGDGRYRVAEHYFLARVLVEQEAHQEVIDACDEVLRPRIMLTWTWGSAAGSCLLWSGRASAALGRETEAAAFFRRLLELRGEAAPSDRLRRAARAGLTAL